APATDVTVPDRRDVPSDPESAAPLAEEVEMPASPGPRPAGAANGRVFASPLARKLAKDAGLGIEDITGTGPRGRILRRDVDAAVAAQQVAQRTDEVDEATTGGAYEEVPHSRVRRATARRLTESKQQAPHFYLRATVRAEALLA